jgi:hypothetical protein
MGFQFSETMAGEAEWDREPGVRHPFRFEITASADSVRAHVRDGRAAVHGVVYAPPLAHAAPADGLMTIRPLGAGFIRYQLAFTGDDGALYEIFGEKRIEWRHLLHSWTHLPAEIRDAGGRRVGKAELRFDLKGDGLRFLRSFRPN